MLLLMIIAEPLIELLYGERWMACVPYFQILCISRLIGVIVPLNMSVISAKGKGLLYLFTQLIKCAFSITVIILSVRHGIYALMIALALIPYFDFLVCSIVNHNLIHYGLFKQLGDVLPTFGIALLIGAFTYCLKFIIPWHPYIVMLLQVFFYMVLYLGITRLMKFEAFTVYYDVLMTKFIKKRKNK